MNYLCSNSTLKALETEETGFIPAKQKTLRTGFINRIVYLQNIYSQRTEKSGASTEHMKWIWGCDNHYLWTLKSNAVKTDWVKNIHFFFKLFLAFWCFCCASWGSGFSVSWHLIEKKINGIGLVGQYHLTDFLQILQEKWTGRDLRKHPNYCGAASNTGHHHKSGSW